MCKKCGRAQSELDFCVSDRDWISVVPPKWNRWALCLSCFEGFAAQQNAAVVRVFLVNGP